MIKLIVLLLMLCLTGCAAYFGENFAIATPFTKVEMSEKKKSIDTNVVPTDIIIK